MGSKWKKIKLSEAVNFRNGAGIKQTFFTEKKDGIPLVKVSNFTLDSVDTSQSMTLVDNAHAENWKSHLLNTDDILIATVGSWPPNWSSVVGKVVRVPPEAANMLQNQNTCCLIPNEDIDSNYLFYVLKSKEFQDWVVNTAQGSANQARVPINMLGHYEISLPEIYHQRNISNFISKLDTKIRINKNINSILENISKALFKSWFVDFDPVIDNALDAGNSIPEVLQSRAELRQKVRNSADFKPLPADIRALFPAEFEETELGWVPKGWKISTAGDELVVKGGLTPSTSNADFWENGTIHWTSPKDLTGNDSKVLLDTSKKITELGLKKISSGLLPTDTVLMSSRAPIGYLALAKTPMAINQGYIAIPSSKNLSPEYIIYWLENIMDDIKGMAGGTTFAEISKGAFKTISLVIPSKNIVDEFTRLAHQHFGKVVSNTEQINALTNLRDTLLPKLISGELSLEDLPNLVAQTEPA